MGVRNMNEGGTQRKRFFFLHRPNALNPKLNFRNPFRGFFKSPSFLIHSFLRFHSLPWTKACRHHPSGHSSRPASSRHYRRLQASPERLPSTPFPRLIAAREREIPSPSTIRLRCRCRRRLHRHDWPKPKPGPPFTNGPFAGRRRSNVRAPPEPPVVASYGVIWDGAHCRSSSRRQALSPFSPCAWEAPFLLRRTPLRHHPHHESRPRLLPITTGFAIRKKNILSTCSFKSWFSDWVCVFVWNRWRMILGWKVATIDVTTRFTGWHTVCKERKEKAFVFSICDSAYVSCLVHVFWDEEKVFDVSLLGLLVYVPW